MLHEGQIDSERSENFVLELEELYEPKHRC